MPNCPKCRVRLALTEDGCLCIRCKREFSPSQVALLPGYNAQEMLQHIELFIVLVGAGLVDKGLNTVIYTDDGIELQRKGEQF